ncbi:MAG: SRPBCC family protein [Bacteroidota bacterium]
MKTRTLTHQDTFEANAVELFNLLHTPSAIKEWWGAAQAIVIPKVGGLWIATWGASEDQPDYITAAKISAFNPPHTLELKDYQYHSNIDEPLPIEMDINTTFQVKPVANGATLKVIQDGLPDQAEADEFYNACVQGWQDTFGGIHDFLA